MPYEYIVYFILYAIWAYVSFKNVKRAIIILPLFFPLYLLRFDIAGIPLYFVEGLILITAIPVFYNILRGEDAELKKKGIFGKLFYILKGAFIKKDDEFKTIYKSPLLPVSIFLVACVISALTVPSGFTVQALGILKSWVIIPIIYFVLFYTVIKDSKSITLSVYSYVGSVVFLCIWALFQEVLGLYNTIDMRVSGPFESANYLAMYIAPAMVFLSVNFIQTYIHKAIESAKTKWLHLERRVYIGIIIALIFLVLVLTQSYGGILAVFVTLFAYIIFERFKRKEKSVRKFLSKLIGFVLLILILGGTLMVVKNYEKFSNLTKFDEHTSIGTRIEIWHVGAGLIKEDPIFGVGLGQYQHNYIDRAEEILGKKPFEEVRLHSHNMIMETWLNSGLLGVIAFVWIIILALLKYNPKLPEDQKRIQFAVLAMLIYILLHGLIDVHFWKNDLALIYWLVIGGVVAKVNN